MLIKPVPGRSVPDPERGGLLPPEGRDVELTQYWQRRLADADVVDASAQSVAPQPSPIADSGSKP